MPINVTVLSPGPFRAGDAVRLAINWTYDNAPEKIVARLIWRTSGKGTTDEIIAVKEEFEPRDNNALADAPPPPPLDGEWETTLTIPPDAPPSYDGRFLSITWFAEADSGRRGTKAESPLLVSPTGRPIVPPFRG